MSTNNIPLIQSLLYRKVPENKAVQMIQWASQRPADESDTCVNSLGRWSLIITYDGMFNEYQLRDNSDGTVFEVPVDEDDMNP